MREIAFDANGPVIPQPDFAVLGYKARPCTGAKICPEAPQEVKELVAKAAGVIPAKVEVDLRQDFQRYQTNPSPSATQTAYQDLVRDGQVSVNVDTGHAELIKP